MKTREKYHPYSSEGERIQYAGFKNHTKTIPLLSKITIPTDQTPAVSNNVEILGVKEKAKCFEYNVNDCVTINSIRGKKVKELNRKGQLFGKPNVLTLFRMGFFGAAHGWGDPNKSPTRP